MYFESIIKSLKNNKIKIYVDMDGVIADYNVIKLTDYSKKRPLFSNIKKHNDTYVIDELLLKIIDAPSKKIFRKTIEAR